VNHRLLISGDSAGGNFTAACVIKLAKDPDYDGLPRPLAAMPIYPVLQIATSMVPSMQYNTPMAASTSKSMAELTSYYGGIDVNKKILAGMSDYVENSYREGHPMHEYYARMDPEKYLRRVTDTTLFSGNMGSDERAVGEHALDNRFYAKAKRSEGYNHKFPDHGSITRLNELMADELVSPGCASDETFKLIVEKGPRFIYLMGSQYCGLRDEGIIYMERLKEQCQILAQEFPDRAGEFNAEERYLCHTAGRTIHGFISGSTSFGRGDPGAKERREWDELYMTWIRTVKDKLLVRARRNSDDGSVEGLDDLKLDH